MPNKQEIVMETTHGRKSKCKTEFKGVINKVLVSGLVLATLMTSTVMPALAASNYSASNINNTGYTQSYGVTAEQSISEIRNTIAAINEMKAKGSVSDAMLQKLASQIYALGQAVSYSDNVDLNSVNSILNEAELAVKGVKGNTNVKVAIATVRATISVDGKGTSGYYGEDYTTNQAEAAPMASSFSDVKQGSWYYDSVTKMTQMGYFAGKGEIVEGVGRFAPNDTMTKAEFLTVVARILYDEDSFSSIQGSTWWTPYYDALVSNGVITTTEFKAEDMNNPMTRQEMAQVAVRVMQARGEKFDSLYVAGVTAAIPDINTVGTAYKNDVLRVYSEGVICGMDDNGTFKPQESLNRASATMVLYRIVEPSVREKKDFSAPPVVKPSDTQGAITIKEGQESERRFAKEGDIVIKADGTQVVLKKGPHGILGEGQGVAPDLGVINDGFTVTAKNITGGSYAGGAGYYDSTGFPIKNQNYYVNKLTGEGHWTVEWEAMTSAPTTNGTFDFQLSADKNWIWNADSGEWMCAYVNNISDPVIQIINQANGL